MSEYVILVDEEDRAIGVEEKLAAHHKGLMHRAFSVFIFSKLYTESPNANDVCLLLQKRSDSKYHSPGIWSNTCCSHPRPEEAVIKAGKRRLRMEMGIDAELHYAGRFHYRAEFPNGLIENEIDHVLVGFMCRKEALIPVNPEEVSDYQWISLEDLRAAYRLKNIQLTPWFMRALGLAEAYVWRELSHPR